MEMKMDLKGTEFGTMDFTELTQNQVQ